MVKLGGSDRQSENMLRAHEQAAAGVRHGYSEEQRQQDIANQNITEGAGAAERAITQRRQEATQKEQFSAQLEEHKAGRLGKEAQEANELSLKAASEGLREVPAGGEVGPPTERQAALASEMERGKKQTEKPISYNAGAKRYESDPNSPIAQQRQLQRSTAETNAAANYLNAESNLAKAKLAGDKVGQAAAQKSLMSPLKNRTAQIDRIKDQKSELDVRDLMSNLKSEWKNNPDPALQKELADGVPGERTMAMLRQAQSVEALHYISSTGSLPDSKDFDMSTPTMQRYFSAVGNVNGMMKTFGGTQLASWAGIKTEGQKSEFLNKLAAWMVTSGQDQAMARPPAAAQQGASSGQPGSGLQPPAPGGAAPGGAAPSATGSRFPGPVNTGQMDQRILSHGAGGKR